MANKEIEYENKKFLISYEILNLSCKETIIFLHGWGSNKELMKRAFGNKFNEYKHVYVDMPGFGKSSNEYELATRDYAQIMSYFLEKLNFDIKIIFGHSFGGKVATLIQPPYLILLSSAGIIEQKTFDVRFKIFFTKILKKIGIGSIAKVFRSNDVQNMSEKMYATFKNVVDEDFTNIFRNYYGNVFIFWGREDNATSLASGQRIKDLIKKSFFKSYNGNHYFFLEHSEDIESTLKEKIS